MTAPILRLDGLSVRYAERVALDPADLAVGPGEVVALLGPSGSGKSSMLRAIAGLEPPASGRIWFEGRDITAQPTHERGFGLMFQDFALFPHRDVGDNVAFGLTIIWSSISLPSSLVLAIQREVSNEPVKVVPKRSAAASLTEVP